MDKRRAVLIFIVSGLVIVFVVLFVIGLLSMDRETGGYTWAGLGDKVALVEIKGAIIESQPTVKELRDFARSGSVKGILLRVESPGGGVAASQEIYDAIGRIRNQYAKPIVVSMGSVAASGGYYISCAGDRIFANPGTITGSIGVILEYPVVRGLMDKVGVEMQAVKSKPAKDVGSPFRYPTAADSQILQAAIDDTYDQFVSVVSERRKLERDSVLRLADGSIYTGRQARQAGLVDTLGSLEDALAYLGEQLGLSREPRVIRAREKKEQSLLDLLGSAAVSYLAPSSQTGPQLQYLFR